jgi:hypothetical protein
VAHRSIPTPRLRLEDVPMEDAEWKSIIPFAPSLSGYEFCGSFEACAEVSRAVEKRLREHNKTESLTIPSK